MRTRVYNDLGAVLAKDQAQRVARRDQRRLEREGDPEWQEIRRVRAEITARDQAAKEAEKVEAEKHMLVGWPGGLSAHIDRGSARAKASFAPYLAQAIADFERDFPDQAPAPTATDIADDITHVRELESRARARRLLEDGVEIGEIAKMLDVRPAHIGDEEMQARAVARQRLRKAADPSQDENDLAGKNTASVAAHDVEPVKRSRGRPRKQIESTDDGAILDEE